MKRKEKNNKTTIIVPTYGFTNNFRNREMWKEIADEYSGGFRIKHTSGYELEIHNNSIPYKKWNINISISDTKPLKFLINFSSKKDFELTISLKDFIERIIEKFSKSDIELGWIEFDKHYLIQSNCSELVKTTITNEIQKNMLMHNVYSLSYQTAPGRETAEMISVIRRRVGNKKMIIELIEMYKLLIDNFENSGIIY